MVDSNHQQIKVVSESFIKPKYEVEASKQPHYLAPDDLIFLPLDHMQKGLLFHGKPQNIQTHLLDKLKISLSQSLVHFYPLAGQLATQKFHDEHAIWVYVDCTTGPGVRLIHAVVNTDLTISDLLSSTDIHPIVPCLFDLGEKAVNHDGHTRPLLSIQVTELLDGVFIGFTLNHSVADGNSLWHFISSLSEIFLQFKDENHSNNVTYNEATKFQSDLSNNIVISRKPIFCKPLLPEGYGPIINLPYFEPDEFVSRFDPGILRERIFHISSKAMSMLKAKANEECENINDHNVISSFQALCAFIWISITRVRNLEPSLMTICPFPLNWRARITPPLSQECFGNYVEGLQCACKVGDLLGHGLGSAALLIQQSVEAVDDSKIRQRLCSYVKAPFLAKTGSTYYEPNGVLIGGSARFDMYGPEFGLGKAVAVLAGYSNKADGKVTVNPGREGGSLDLEICLKPETMNALESDEEFMSFVLAK
ncbi:uncharacterized acetyltransferase At3g50280-like [Chenopodium quinoa]|uniref:uncharacterized acetyltransferase At3g50280-like n=1 Tax=Chenopodium quinoa TaxID=63459 RepID=UPI000B783710|nr:uncharacterized acetyltransferase At3g50280-like [Chenopodium quinoa]